MPAVEFQNPLSRIVEEITVVCDRHHRTREFAQEHLKPLNTFRIQVVGGLIQQKHIGLGQQKTTQRHPTLFTTRELIHLCIPGGDTQCICRYFHLGFDIV